MDDFIQVMPCLTPGELQSVKIMIDEITDDWKSATILDGGGTVNKSVRKTDLLSINRDSALFSVVHSKFNKAMENYAQILKEKFGDQVDVFPMMCSPGSNSWSEGLQLLRYRPGDFYRWHMDKNAENIDESFHRTFSIILYLTDDFEGGGTEFHHKTIKPKAGEVIVFPSNWVFLHRGQEVTAGEKQIIVTWYSVTR